MRVCSSCSAPTTKSTVQNSDGIVTYALNCTGFHLASSACGEQPVSDERSTQTGANKVLLCALDNAGIGARKRQRVLAHLLGEERARVPASIKPSVQSQ